MHSRIRITIKRYEVHLFIISFLVDAIEKGILTTFWTCRCKFIDVIHDRVLFYFNYIIFWSASFRSTYRDGLPISLFLSLPNLTNNPKHQIFSCSRVLTKLLTISIFYFDESALKSILSFMKPNSFFNIINSSSNHLGIHLIPNEITWSGSSIQTSRMSGLLGTSGVMISIKSSSSMLSSCSSSHSRDTYVISWYSMKSLGSSRLWIRFELGNGVEALGSMISLSYVWLSGDWFWIRDSRTLLGRDKSNCNEVTYDDDSKYLYAFLQEVKIILCWVYYIIYFYLTYLGSVSKVNPKRYLT